MSSRRDGWKAGGGKRWLVLTFLIVSVLLLACRPAHAYIDPNTFHSLFGSIWPVLAALAGALGVLFWPLRWALGRLWSRARRGRAVAAAGRAVRAHPRRAFLASAIALGVLVLGAWRLLLRRRRFAQPSSGKRHPRVIILGIDGLDPGIVEPMMAAGELPQLRRLRDQGGFARLATSNPAHSPNAWTCIATGCDAGQHGVFDFIVRDPETYRLDLAVLRHNPGNPLGQRDRMFLPVRRCPAFWQLVSEAGIPATVVRWPVTFPPDGLTGRMLSGLGVPDIKGGLGSCTFYTTRRPSPREEGLEKAVVVSASGNVIETTVQGPAVAGLAGSRQASVPLKIVLRPDGRGVTLAIGRESHDVDVGQWSGCIRLRFDPGMGGGTIVGIVRFWLKALRPHLELYMSPIEVDPLDPAFPICSPGEYARELAQAIGPFRTLGMPEDTTALTEGRLDADAFLHLCGEINGERERMLLHELGRFDDGLLAVVADTSDRLQHMFWVTRDPEHPLYDPGFAKRYAGVIPDVYRHADKLVGHVLECADSNTLVMVVSDHGFAPFRRAVHLNSWLAASGFLLRKAAPADPEGGPAFENVVWDETSAYSLGFGGIYVNLRGREGRGAVEQGSQYRTVCERIASGLQALRDPKTSRRPVRRVYHRDELYHGPRGSEGPDLVVGFEPGYRASWQTALGGAPENLFDDNRRLWSGDHIVDPECVPGILLANRPLLRPEPSQMDIAPTILSAFSLSRAEGMKGDAVF